MFHLSLNMPLWAMGFYGGAMIAVLLLLRALLGPRLPRLILPLLWVVVMVRLLLPVAVSSPLALHLPWEELRGILPLPGVTAATASDYGEETAHAAESVGKSTDLSFVRDSVPPAAAETAATSYVPKSVYAHFWSFEFWQWVSLLWAAGALAVAVLLAAGLWRSWAALNRAYFLEHNGVIAQVLEDLGVKRARVYTCDNLPSPLAAGVFLPRIFLPASMDFSDERMLRHIITHEAMHIKRGDNLLKALMLPILCLHWYNPLVWVMSRQLARDLEAACDEATLTALSSGEGDERQSYACSLVSMAAPSLRGGLFYSAFCKSEIERRVRGVLSFRRWGRAAAVLAVLLMLCASTAFALGSLPLFNNSLSSYCVSGASPYAVRVMLNRDVSFSESRQKVQSRADDAILRLLAQWDGEEGPRAIKGRVAGELAGLFGLEPGAFEVRISLHLSDEERFVQYAAQGIEYQDNRFYYKGELVRHLEDNADSLGVYHSYSYADGLLDIYLSRDETGRINGAQIFRISDS